MVASDDQSNTNTDSSEGSNKAPQETETLGVLLVHGIGSQRRGDTLVHCATALHSWLRDWLKPRWNEYRPVGLVDVSVAEAKADRPAQARIIFRRRGHIRNVSWLIVESCWFETYRRPGFYEFIRWALGVIPVAIIVHLVPNYRRLWDGFEASVRALKSRTLSERDFLLIKRDLGPAAAGKTIRDVEQRAFLSSYQWGLHRRLFGMHIKLTLLVNVGIVFQLLLIVVAILAIVPGITRSFAGWVQRKISATLGDSFLFVTSPITNAAILTRVRKDLDWLSARCERVVVIAHSQGAAVSYQVIEQQFLEGQTFRKIHALVTYGSGLRKLFDLETNVKGGHLLFWIVVSVWSIVMAISTSALIALFLGGIISWWWLLALPLFVELQMLPLIGPKATFQDPASLPIPWYDLYSSHDPVPNGPIDVVPTSLQRGDTVGAASELDVTEFYSRQREVVNRRSVLSDHTSYWSSRDDFVERVAGILAKISKMPQIILDEEWMKVSRKRRLWRVTWLSRCRAVTGLACLSILFWPRSMLEPAANSARELIAVAAANLPESLAAWTPSAARVPDLLLGAGALALASYLMFLVALANWALWEKQELRRFFRREPHPSIGGMGWIFALGWLGVLVSAPAYTLAYVHSDWRSILAVLWAPLILAVWSIRMMYKSGHGPGTPLEWGRIALARAEAAVADNDRDRTESLWEAECCFATSHKWLGMKHSGSDEWVRAVLGETWAVEERAKFASTSRDKALEIYRRAIQALKSAGHDPSEVQLREKRTLLR
ncbi:hypothetical protein JQ625_23295 [Bradyrhizobium diazoefficiens]|nr:hypothetical protein [Bradyrhizobium diazoefficiens]MBR0777771.1 hypothetical protein [Bradyrhizobium diazoefficiens]